MSKQLENVHFKVEKMTFGISRLASQVERGADVDADLIVNQMAMHMVTGDEDVPVHKQTAINYLDSLDTDEIKAAFMEFLEAVKEQAVPPQNGTD